MLINVYIRIYTSTHTHNTNTYGKNRASQINKESKDELENGTWNPGMLTTDNKYDCTATSPYTHTQDKQTHRLMQQNRKSRNKSKHIWSINL